MGDRAEVSHQPRTSDDHSLRLGCWADGGYTLRQTASIGLGPVRLPSGPAPQVWGPLVRAAGRPVAVWEGLCAGRRRFGEPGGLVRGHSLMVGAYGAGGCTPRVRGHVVAGGDVRRRRGRESCPRTRGLSPAGADRTRPRGMSPAASGMRSPQAAAEVRDPRQSCPTPAVNRLGVRLEEARSR